MTIFQKDDRVIRKSAKIVTKQPPVGVVVSIDYSTQEALVHWRHKPYRVPLRDLELAR